MENSNKKVETKVNEKIVSLNEDGKYHKHDDSSYQKAIKIQENLKKQNQTEKK